MSSYEARWQAIKVGRVTLSHGTSSLHTAHLHSTSIVCAHLDAGNAGVGLILTTAYLRLIIWDSKRGLPLGAITITRQSAHACV